MVSASRVKTNWLLLEDLDFWDEFTTKAINDTDTEDYFKQIDQAIDDKLAETIKWLDSDEAKEYFQQEAEYQEEVFEALEEEWDNILSGEISSVDELLDRIYEHGKQQGYNDIRERIRYTDADRQALQFAKDYNFQLIQKLDDNLRDAIKNRVIQAVASGEHPYELAPKIQELGVQPLPGSTLSARHRAVMIARTETARVQNTGIIQSYVNEGFTEVNILTAEDSSVCRLCLANAYEFNTDEIILENRGADRTHKIKDMNSNSWVPLHPNCRCTYVVVWDSQGDVPENPEPVKLTPPKTDKPLNTPEAVADYYDLDFEEKDGSYLFHDKKYNCTITFPKNYIDKKGRYNQYIDMSSSGKGKYDLKEIMDIYTNAPSVLKHATNNIKFNNRKGRKKVLGFATLFTEKEKKVITINPLALELNKHIRGNFQQTLYHEMGHCLSMSMMDKEFANLLNKYVTAGKFVEGTPIEICKEINHKLKKGYDCGISRTDEFRNIVSKNRKYQKENNLPVEKASLYATKSYEEDWAEICSMASVHGADKETLNRAVLQNYNYEYVKYEEWVKNNKVVYEWAVEKLTSIKYKDFNY